MAQKVYDLEEHGGLTLAPAVMVGRSTREAAGILAEIGMSASTVTQATLVGVVAVGWQAGYTAAAEALTKALRDGAA